MTRKYIVVLATIDDRLKEILIADKEARGIIDFTLKELGTDLSSASLTGLVMREVDGVEHSFSLIKVLDPSKEIKPGYVVEFRHASSQPLLATCVFIEQVS